MTTVWSYGSRTTNGAFNYPAFTIEARAERPVRVTWVNDLVDAGGYFLPHLLPVDPTLHWANPPGGISGPDSRPEFASTPGRYTGPVPIVMHLHGGHSFEESDGFAEAWYLPAAGNIPSGFAAVGSFYDEFKTEFGDKYGASWNPGSAVFQYDNDQPASTLWYHDHTLGMTRANVYAGPAGFYLLRGGGYDLAGELPGPGLPHGGRLDHAPGHAVPRGTSQVERHEHAARRPRCPADAATTRRTRQVSLNEADSETIPDFGPSMASLGTLSAAGEGNPLGWADEITEHVAVGTTEVWEMYNFTEDAHPIHIHEVQFEVVDRQPIDDGGPRPPEAWETGVKDTVISYPGEITRVKALFDRAGRFVWHCHLVEHEDNEMMRPYEIIAGSGPRPAHEPAGEPGSSPRLRP